MASGKSIALSLLILVMITSGVVLAQDGGPEPLGVVEFELCPQFDDVTVTVVGDAGHNLGPYSFWADDFAEMGINIEIIEVPFADVYQVREDRVRCRDRRVRCRDVLPCLHWRLCDQWLPPTP